jgi:hypothetical protein
VVTTFDAQGNVLDGPRTFLNVIDRSGSRFRLVRRGPVSDQAGRFAPYSMASSIALEQRLTSLLKVQVKYTYRDSYGLVTISPQLLTTGQNALVMQDGGSSRYREFQFTARIAEERKRKVFVSYVHSSTRGSLDAVSSYAGDVAFPVVRPSFFTNLGGDVPHRLLLWGETPLKWKMKVMPLAEYRTGFPFSVVDEEDFLVGAPNSRRYPDYFNINLHLERKFRALHYLSAWRFGYNNLTANLNPNVVNNVQGTPRFLTYGRGQARAFSVRLRLLGRK